MKKILALALSASIFGAMPMVAQETTPSVPSASKVLYDFKDYDVAKVIKYFKELEDEGRKFPTAEEFKAKFGIDVELVRSHVRKREVLKWKDGKDPLDFARREGRTVFMNLPTGTEKGTGGFPSGQFDNDPYTLWQYTDLWGAWNHGFFQAPGSWAATAHKHGVDMMSGIAFFDTTGNPGGESSGKYEGFILTKDDQGNYKYAKPLIHVLMYLGLDGINYNWESSGYTGADVVAFHKALRNYAKEQGFDNYRQAIYTSRSYFRDDHQYVNSWLWDSEKKDHIGSIMLNYSSGDFNTYSIDDTERIAKAVTGSYDNYYQGAWIVTMNRSFATMEGKKSNLCLWGEHAMSRFVSNNTGANATEKMHNLQFLFERAFSGGSRNVGTKDFWSASDWGDKLANFGGISRMIPERTTLKQDLPFRTFFNTGAGERYFYKGKSASMGGWYDMAAQDLQPTYRWLQYKKGTKETLVPVQVEYTYDDAYVGGSSLRFKGAQAVDVILYRGLITVGEGTPMAKLAFKAVDAEKKANGLVLLLHKQGAGDTEYVEVAFDDLKDKTWEEQEKAITGLAKGDVIDLVGIRMTKDADVYLGELAIFDDTVASEAPSMPKNLKVEVKQEKVKSLAAMLSWEVDALASKTPTRKDNGLVYNDEAGIHHFEILYKEGADGAVREIGRTESWSTYAPKVEFEANAEDSEGNPFFGVRAVANDLKTVSDITWVEVERQESVDLPEEDRYCKSELNPKANGADVARRIRFLDKVSTTGAKVNLDYTSDTPDTDGDNYVYYKNSGFTVEQGKEIEFFFRAFGRQVAPNTPTRDGLQWCWAATYIDWNNNGAFEADTDERIDALDLGSARKATPEFQTTGVTKKFTVPADATPGTVRVRVVFTDAWFPTPTPCGVTAKGFTFDFDMKIVGDNPGREGADKHDAGVPEAPEKGITKVEKTVALTLPTVENGTVKFVNVTDASKVAVGTEVMLSVEPAEGYVLETLTVNGKDIKDSKKFMVGEKNEIKVTFKKANSIEELEEGNLPSFYPNPATSVVNFKNTDIAWIYSLEGKLVLVVKDTTKSADVSALPAGTYVVKAERNNVTRSYKLIKK